MYRLVCIECGKESNERSYTCECGGLLEVRFEDVEIDFKLNGKNLSVWKYRCLLPVKREPVTLREGGTPLYEISRGLYVKHEGANPSGSFKDRGMTVGVTKALELGKNAVACASTGNTSASMAMYAAKAGLKAYVLLPSGKVALGKVAQALMHGAKVIAIRGNFDRALELVRIVCERMGFYLLNSVNPFRLEGQKTIAFEIVDEIGVPDYVILPVGNAGNISAIWKGFKELKMFGLIDYLPKMVGVQAKGANPIYKAVKEGKDRIEPIKNPETVATAIRIGNPVNAKKALRAIYESKGTVVEVSDEEILDAQRELARNGIGVEPASASSLAGYRILINEGYLNGDETVVCIATGHLLKDPEIILKMCGRPIEVSADFNEIVKVL